MAITAYLRVSTDAQDVANQKMGIAAYCAKNWPGEPVAYVEDNVSGKLDWHKRQLGGILLNAHAGDVVVVSEVSRMARTLLQVLEMMRHCAEKSIQLHVVKSNIVLDGSMQSKVTATVFGLAAEIERDFISSRTKEALARKRAEGVRLGRPPVRSKNLKLDASARQIDDLLKKKIGKRSIAKLLNVSPNTLYNWLDVRRGFKQESELAR